MLCHTCTGSVEGGVTSVLGLSRAEGLLVGIGSERSVIPVLGLLRVEGWLARYWIRMLCHTCTGSVEGGVTSVLGLSLIHI